MNKKSDNSSSGCLIGIFSVILIAFFGIFKLIIDGIIKFVRWIIKTRHCKKIINDITVLPFENAKVKDYYSDLSDESLKQILNIFNKDYYDNLFPIQIRNRGESYYDDGRIKKIKHQENKYTCIVEGTTEYDVLIEFYGSTDTIKNMKCTCPYFADHNNNCKHIYALLYKIKCHQNKKEIIKEIQENINGNKQMLNNFQIYLNKRKNVFTDKMLKRYYEYIHRYDEKFSHIEEEIIKPHLEEILIKYLLEVIVIRRDLANKVRDVVYIEWEIISQKSKNIPTTTSTLKTVSNLSSAVFFSSLLDNEKVKGDKMSDNELEERMNNLDLEDWQKDLVREGKYDPENFEEDDSSDEDDYYHEDDE